MFVVTQEEFKEMLLEVKNHQAGYESIKKLSEHIVFSIKSQYNEYVLTLVENIGNFGEICVVVSKEEYYIIKQEQFTIRFRLFHLLEINDDYFKLDVEKLREILFLKMDVASF